MNCISLLSYKPKAGSTKATFPRLLRGKHPCVNIVRKGKVHLDPKSHTSIQKENQLNNGG